MLQMMRNLCCFVLILGLSSAWALDASKHLDHHATGKATLTATDDTEAVKERLHNSLALPTSFKRTRPAQAPAAPHQEGSIPVASTTPKPPTVAAGSKKTEDKAAPITDKPESKPAVSVSVTVGSAPLSDSGVTNFQDMFKTIVAESAAEVLGMEHFISDSMQDMFGSLMSAPHIPYILNLLDEVDKEEEAIRVNSRRGSSSSNPPKGTEVAAVVAPSSRDSSSLDKSTLEQDLFDAFLEAPHIPYLMNIMEDFQLENQAIMEASSSSSSSISPNGTKVDVVITSSSAKDSRNPGKAWRQVTVSSNNPKTLQQLVAELEQQLPSNSPGRKLLSGQGRVQASDLVKILAVAARKLHAAQHAASVV